MRKMRRFCGLSVCLVAVLAVGCTHAKPRSGGPAQTQVLTQYSTIGALLIGLYDGQLTMRELRRFGDLGLGTFNALDGEMVVLDGVAYQVRYDGAVVVPRDDVKTPFAAVSFFNADQVFALEQGLDYAGFQQALTERLPSRNLFYAIRVEGRFPYVKTRSVPRQEPPYPPLAQVVQQQSIFEFHNVQGTLVGYWCPHYAENVNVPGYHLHFLTEDRRAGGHVLDLELGEHQVLLDNLGAFTMLLPNKGPFLDADLTGDHKDDLPEVEGRQTRAASTNG